MKALWHPTRARIIELLKGGPANRARLAELSGAPYAAVAYHCRVLVSLRRARYAPGSNVESEDPFFIAA